MRFCVLLVAGGCMVGCARSDDGINEAGLNGPRALAEGLSDDDINDASRKGDRTFADKSGAEPLALLRGRVVILKPSRIAFRIPQAWLDHYDSPPKYPVANLREIVTDPNDLDRYYSPKNNLHFTREELDQVESGEGNEWDVTFAKLVNELLPFEKCVFHGGGEGWGQQGHSFADLQMRVYLGSWDLVDIEKLVGERGLPAVRRISHGTPTWDRTKTAGWQVESLTFPMWFFDYGDTAVVDFYIRKFHKATIVLVFMHTTFRGSQEVELQEVVNSLRMTQIH
jgi:hypothetical protein